MPLVVVMWGMMCLIDLLLLFFTVHELEFEPTVDKFYGYLPNTTWQSSINVALLYLVMAA